MGLNEIGRARFSFFQPLFCDEYERNRQTGSFVVIDPLTNFTVGAGMVIDRARRRGLAPGAQRNRQPHISWQRGRSPPRTGRACSGSGRSRSG